MSDPMLITSSDVALLLTVSNEGEVLVSGTTPRGDVPEMLRLIADQLERPTTRPPGDDR